MVSGRNLANQAPQIRVASATAQRSQRRLFRRPMHTFNLKSKPFEVQPFFIAPVLPGETLDNMLVQATAVTDPIQNSLIGWWKEYYVFYVKHRGLAATDTTGLLQSMMLDPTTSVATLKAGANALPNYTFKGGMDYVSMCQRAVMQEFFRDEGETWNSPLIENQPAAQINHESWLQSMKLESAMADDMELPGIDEIEDLDILAGFSTQYAQWELMRDQGMTDLTYEDYLRSYGVSIPKSEDEGGTPDERHRPELVRFFRKYTAPSNVINPSDGAAKSAAYWQIAEKADKKRYFKEPGFLFGVTVTRPKLYWGSQKGAAVGLLDNYLGWLPAVLDGYPYTSVAETLDSATDGILQNQTEDYWFDLKDLYMYGDQFVNFAMSAAANHGLALPTAANVYKYPTDAMVESLFVTAGSEYVKEDGVVHLNILSRLRDTTP